MSAAREFPLAPLSRAAQWFFPGLWLALVAVSLLLRHDTLLQHDQGNPAPTWLVVILACALAAAIPWILLQYRHVRLDGDTLAITAAGLFTHKIRVDAFDLQRARIISLEEHHEYKPRIRLLGFGLPGFHAGHYLLRNRARAFVLLTSVERVLVLPRRDGKFLLLSPERPQELLDSLHRLAPAGRQA